MTSPPSGSDETASSAFDLYDERIRRWIWRQGWAALRDVQEQAAAPVLAGDRDVVIASATASGKTEAAMFPALTRILAQPAPRLRLLAVSPLKALINDQYRRLEDICEPLELGVHRWHGDVASSRKKAVLERGDGVLLITPESLEALFIIHGPRMAEMLRDVAYVLVDELHAFIGTERGKQLQSLLHRVELAVRRRVPRLALSATLGDMNLAAEFLRPGAGARVTRIVSDVNRHDVALQVRGYLATAPVLSSKEAAATARAGEDVALDDVVGGDAAAIAADLWRVLRGGRHIVFTNRRADVEIYADLLRGRAERERVPAEFWPHHGSLSKELREDAESALKDTTKPATVIATTTLELGIDVGSVESVAQIGPATSVAAMRQRLGRSGRSADAASILRVYVSEPEITSNTAPQDTLRTSLVQCVAMVRLLMQRWVEPPNPAALHLSTLVQQTLSLVAQHGGVTAADAFSALCHPSAPFAPVGKERFIALLRSLASNDLLIQTHDGQLVLGLDGERLVNHYDFYAAFAAADEYRLVTGSTTLGTLPVDVPLLQGMHLIFGGRRWVVVDVDTARKVVEVATSPGGRPPSFGGGGASVHDRVRSEMLAVYHDEDVPSYLTSTAKELLAEGRRWYARHEIGRNAVMSWGDGTLLFPWTGDRVLHTLVLQLTAAGVKADVEDVALYVDQSRDQVMSSLESLAAAGLADPVELACKVENADVEKHHRWLDADLLAADYASSRLDTAGALHAVHALIGGGSQEHG